MGCYQPALSGIKCILHTSDNDELSQQPREYQQQNIRMSRTSKIIRTKQE
jgi:hypothetical protein